MKQKETQLLRIMELKYQVAEKDVAKAKSVCDDIAHQIATVNARRNIPPEDPADQIFHERHIGWLDQRSRELSIQAANAAVDHANARETLRVEFGRKSALSKALEQKAKVEELRISRQ